MISKNPSKSFLTSFLLIVSIVPIFYILFILVVDPYGFFKLVEIKGFNGLKPQVAHQVRLTKAHHIYRLQPTNIILGSSRIEMGFDPDSLIWKNFPGTTYNMGLAGIGLEEIYKTLKHVYFSSRNLKTVIVGLDFFMFNAHRENVVFSTEVTNFDEKRLLLSPTDSYLDSVFHDVDFFIGSKAALASWETVRQNLYGLSHNQIYLYNGFKISNKVHELVGTFSDQERGYLMKIWRSGPEKRYCFSFKGIHTFETFRNIVDFAYEKGIDLRFFINPEHARMLLTIKEGGLWVQFEDWKREMVKVLEEESKKYQKPLFPLWDFSGFNSVTTEPVLAGGREMEWYWEGSHYKIKTGEAMLSKILDCLIPEYSNLKDFGVCLNPVITEDHLKNTRIKMRLYENKFPEDAKCVKKVANEVLKDSNGSNCGHDCEQLFIGSEALKKGDLKMANLAFDRALELHLLEKKRADDIGVPFREDKFMGNLEKARRLNF